MPWDSCTQVTSLLELTPSECPWLFSDLQGSRLGYMEEKGLQSHWRMDGRLGERDIRKVHLSSALVPHTYHVSCGSLSPWEVPAVMSDAGLQLLLLQKLPYELGDYMSMPA